MPPIDSERWDLLLNLFDTAIELPEEECEGFIVSHAGGDDELLGSLRRMIAADQEARSKQFLDVPLGSSTRSIASSNTVDSYEPGSRQFGPYHLLRLIGVGGMGEVHLAERSDGMFEQRVALKLLPHPTPGLVRRFNQERQILARLEHPNIAHLLDGGIGEGGVPYFAMEFVQGERVTDFVRKDHLSVAQTLSLFLAICDGVQYAHRNLVVHRDLKPSNILVTADGKPKLLDFGIAKVIQITGDSDVTQTNARVFTPDYASPEQIRGEPVATATDVYALGVVLYELLSGTRPYTLSGHTALGDAIQTVDPMPPSARLDKTDGSMTQRRRELRGDLDRIVLKALAKEPERRYLSVEALGADLRRFLDGRPIEARNDNALYRARKFVRRNRTAVVAAGIVIIALAVATAISVRAAATARRQAATAAQQRDLFRNEYAHTQTSLHYLALVFGEVQKTMDKPELLHDALAHGATELDQRLADNPLEQASMMRFVGELFTELDDDKAAAPLLRDYLQSPSAAGNPLESAEARMYLAEAELRLGNAKEAKDAIDRAQAFWTADETGFADKLLRSRIVQGQIQKALGDLGGAIATYRGALPQARSVLGPVNETTVQLANSLSLALMQNGELDEAGRLMDEVIVGYRSPQLRADQGAALIAEQNRGAIAYRQGDYVRAESSLRHAIEERQRQLGPSAALASGEMNLGKTLIALHRPADAAKVFDEALPMAREFSGERSPLTLATIQSAAAAQIALGNSERASSLAGLAVQLSHEQYGDAHPLYAVSVLLQAQVLHLQKRDAEARTGADRAVSLIQAAGQAGKSYLPEAVAVQKTLQND